eukprot:8379420-Heterocapsa_arctica.AAC.1
MDVGGLGAKGKGKCRRCNKPRHFEKDCWATVPIKGKGKEKGEKGKGDLKGKGKGAATTPFQGECNFCQRWGH